MTVKRRFKELIKDDYFVRKRLIELGITEIYKGYYFLVDILSYLINTNNSVRSFSTEIYPIVAKKFNISECIIERDIRNVINVLWDYKLKSKLECLWPYEKKPTCCKFIYVIKNYVVIDLS